MLLIEKEEDKLLTLKLNISNFENYKNNNCDVFQTHIEDKIKKYVIKKIKENCTNIIEFSKKNNIPVKNILYTLFLHHFSFNLPFACARRAEMNGLDRLLCAYSMRKGVNLNPWNKSITKSIHLF